MRCANLSLVQLLKEPRRRLLQQKSPLLGVQTRNVQSAKFTGSRGVVLSRARAKKSTDKSRHLRGKVHVRGAALSPRLLRVCLPYGFTACCGAA
eukprot:scaffold15045_cov66-Phaeocystis_antarctica.AAC.1